MPEPFSVFRGATAEDGGIQPKLSAIALEQRGTGTMRILQVLLRDYERCGAIALIIPATYKDVCSAEQAFQLDGALSLFGPGADRQLLN
jgi:hypothetical protein